MTKVAVGVRSLSALTNRQARRVTVGGTVTCHTRYKPTRAAELLAGGSIYWIMKHTLAARQRIVGFETVGDGAAKRCHIILDPEVVPVLATPLRAHQGWRYLGVDAAPPDLDAAGVEVAALPVPMMRDLRNLGLI